MKPYDFDKGKLIVKEMTELLSLNLVRKGMVTKKIELTIEYDRAAQFAPFAALSGYDEMVNEEARYVGQQIELMKGDRASEPKVYSDCRCDRGWNKTNSFHHLV